MKSKILVLLLVLLAVNFNGIQAQVNVDFTVSDHDICQGQSIIFVDASTGPIVNWAWYFSWKATPQDWYERNVPPIQFGAAGGAIVWLTVTDTLGKSYTKYDTINIWPYPQIKIIPQNPVICQGEFITLRAKANSIGSFVWVFQNDTVGTDSSFATNSSGQIALYFTDTNGCQSSYYAYINKSALEEVRIYSNGQITNDTVNFCEGNYNYLYAQANASNFVWSNGSVGYSLSVDSPGAYFVTATDYLGCSLSSDTIIVQIHVPPDAPIIASNMPDTLCEGNPVELTAPDGYAGYNWYGYFGNQKSITVYYSGTYRLRVMDENGCESPESSVTLDFYPQPNKLEIVVGDNCYLGAPLIEDVIYQWLYEDDTIPGANDRFFQADSSGFYTVVVTNVYGCSSMSDMVYASCLPSKIEENTSLPGVSVYPNPFSEIMTVKVSDNDEYQFSLIDVLGREVRRGMFSNNVRIERDNLPAGIYSLNIYGNGKSGSFRIIAE